MDFPGRPILYNWSLVEEVAGEQEYLRPGQRLAEAVPLPEAEGHQCGMRPEPSTRLINEPRGVEGKWVREVPLESVQQSHFGS